MNENLNLAPIQELLTTSICPQDLAEVLDNLMFDYIHAIINLHLETGGKDDVIHCETTDYLFRIRELRDVFWMCKE